MRSLFLMPSGVWIPFGQLSSDHQKLVTAIDKAASGSPRYACIEADIKCTGGPDMLAQFEHPFTWPENRGKPVQVDPAYRARFMPKVPVLVSNLVAAE